MHPPGPETPPAVTPAETVGSVPPSPTVRAPAPTLGTPRTEWRGQSVPPATPPITLASLGELFQQAQDLDRLKTLEARLKFQLIIIPEDGRGFCQSFDTVAQAVEAIRPVIGQQGQIFLFRGDRWNLTRGPMKFLVPPAGQGDRIPLFQSLDQLDVDPDGNTSLDSIEPEDAIPADALPSSTP